MGNRDPNDIIQGVKMIEEERMSGWNADQDDGETRLQEYGLYLKDNDFEKYQPFCYINHDSLEYMLGLREAEAELTRALWISQRFTTYYDIAWHQLNEKILFHTQMIKKLDRMIGGYRQFDAERRH